MNQSPKIAVIAYSGGLDTSYCLKYLQDLGYAVHTVLVNTGGFDDQELDSIKQKALELGSEQHHNLDRVNDFYTSCVKYLIYGNVLKNNTYPLSVSAERVVQARAIAEYCKSVDASCVVHGSTGAGNDQIRFDLIFNVLIPDTEIITPIRDQGLTRQQEIDYLKEKGVDLPWHKAKYSINKGLWGTSVGGAETLTSHLPLPSEAYPNQLQKDLSDQLEIGFEKGQPVSLNGKKMEPVELIQTLNDLGGQFAIGRDIHVGDTIIGIKGRVAFEAPAAQLLIKAHHLLEKHTLSKWQLYWKEQLANWYGTLLHEGQYLEPVMRNIEHFLEDTQETVSGTVFLALHPYRFELLGVEADNDLMDTDFGTYGEENGLWSGQDARGFTKIMAVAQKIAHQKGAGND